MVAVWEPLKLSMKAFCWGLPAAMECQSTSICWHQCRTTMLVD